MSVDVAAIRAALAKATPGPWDAEDEMIGAGDYWIFATGLSAAKQTAEQAEADADLIVLLRNNAEALLDQWADSLAALDRVCAQAERRGAVRELRAQATSIRYSATSSTGHDDWTAGALGAANTLDRRADAIENGADL